MQVSLLPWARYLIAFLSGVAISAGGEMFFFFPGASSRATFFPLSRNKGKQKKVEMWCVGKSDLDGASINKKEKEFHEGKFVWKTFLLLPPSLFMDKNGLSPLLSSSSRVL